MGDKQENMANKLAAADNELESVEDEYRITVPKNKDNKSREFLKGWFTKNTSYVYMKEFVELVRMVYAIYSNSAPTARNLKIKN